MATEPVTPETDMSRCERCGHVQAEPNWCHACGGRTMWPEWAHKLDAERADLRANNRRLYEALSEITEACRSGDFYKDYDESCAIIGRCDKALEG